MTTESGETTLSGIVHFSKPQDAMFYQGQRKVQSWNSFINAQGYNTIFILYALEIISVMVIWEIMVNCSAVCPYKYGFIYKQVSIRNQKSRWGSCSINNNISLNIQLMGLPHKLIDYVLLHELVHTLVKNHSVLFWNTLNKYVRNAKNLDKDLKKYYLS